MSADLFREAAARMGESTSDVPDSPWYAFAVTERRGHSEWVVDSPSRLIAGNLGIDEDPKAEPTADYIASWHPDVARAAARLLSAAAAALDELEPHQPESDAIPTWLHAELENFARVYLGCSCPTDAEIRAAIHHSHQQLTGGNNQ